MEIRPIHLKAANESKWLYVREKSWREAAGWISVGGQTPKIGLKCLITDGDKVMRGYLRRDGIWKYGIELEETWDRLSSWPVTHWMPLPMPPDLQQAEE